MLGPAHRALPAPQPHLGQAGAAGTAGKGAAAERSGFRRARPIRARLGAARGCGADGVRPGREELRRGRALAAFAVVGGDCGDGAAASVLSEKLTQTETDIL